MSDKTAVGAYDDDHRDSTCPNCGYCPTCGRTSTPSYPVYPWVYPTWVGPYRFLPNITWTVTSATSSGYVSSTADASTNIVYLNRTA